MTGQSQDRDERTGAELLREAARLMRQRAEKANGVMWRPSWNVNIGTSLVIEQQTGTVLSEYFDASADAEFAASWNPAVAIAVADWLDAVARSAEEVHAHVEEMWWGEQAVAVATAYLAAPVSAGEPKEDA